MVREYEENYEIYMEQQARAKEIAAQYAGSPVNATASGSKVRMIAPKPKSAKPAPKARAPTPTWTESEDEA